MWRAWIVGCLLIFAVGLGSTTGSVAAQAPLGDYGDAPDLAFGDRFPTSADTANADLEGWTGPVHLDSSQEWLGESVNAEEGPRAPQDDFDDGWDVSLGTFTVTLSEDAPEGTRYLNVVADLNNSGHWNSTRGYPEWMVRNMPIDQAPNTTKSYEVPLEIPAGRWVRVTLTREPIPEELFAEVGGWDGSGPVGGFAFGETEDYFTERAVRPPSPPVSLATPECGLIVSLLNNLTWIRGREGRSLEEIRTELPQFLADLETPTEQTQAAIDAFFTTLGDAEPTDYVAIFAATEAARASWEGCEQFVSPDTCAVVPFIYARFFSAPDVNSEFVDELDNNYFLSILAQSEDGAWLQVRMPNGLSAWVPMVLMSSYCIE